MSKVKVQIKKVIRILPGGFHCECDSNVGIIKSKENKNVPQNIWDNFINNVKYSMPPIFKQESWWERLVLFIKKIWERKKIE